MTPALAVATAVTFVWLGMVLAISFLKAPLKFRAGHARLSAKRARVEPDQCGSRYQVQEAADA